MFENPLFLIPFMAGALFIFAGLIMLKFPPKKINSLYGYRTLNAMKSQERWDFAQNYSAKEMIKLGLLLIVCCILSFITKFDPITNRNIGLFFLILTVIVLLVRVEKAIKNKFGRL
ncbi:SdpI family protein [Flavobacterium sandaracinum]|uniref:SdpI family protein n=1 Tax=Flavobacterium sandaracinum TaxID=2541733 RepID=A0A4R5D6J5_9FLAO|nr:SdpI family protein [Flavobacterium sandaracinum]TDE07261.1 SdpI family protein [Flavobacterium sandaracinum]